MENLTAFSPYQLAQIEQILISDLHLPFEPVSNPLEQAFLARAFLNLLDICISLPNLQTLYILGDWFEAWLGDDIANMAEMQAWLAPMRQKLQTLTQNNVAILVMTGNRDFLLGQAFCDSFGGQYIAEPYYFNYHDKKIRLEHGDRLCTDDKKYQYFRKVIQHPITKKLLLLQNPKKRQQIANNLRDTSKQANREKTMHIMDVNAEAVKNVLKSCNVLVHGHTHRPQIEALAYDKTRVVLGDWRVLDSEVEAVIGVIGLEKDSQIKQSDPITLVKFIYQF